MMSILLERVASSEAASFGLSNAKLFFMIIVVFYFLININHINQLFFMSWRMFFPLFLFVFYFTLSTSWAENILFVYIISYIQLFILSYLVFKVIKDMEGLNIFISTLSLSGTVVTTLLLLEYLGNYDSYINDSTIEFYRSQGKLFILNSNFSATMATLPFIYYYVKYFLLEEKKNIYLFLIIYNFIGLLITVSISALIAILLIVLISLKQYGKLTRGVVGVSSLVMIILLLVNVFNINILPLHGITTRVKILMDMDKEILFNILPRVNIWQFAISLFSENPFFGYGFQSFLNFSELRPSYVAPKIPGHVAMHSQYLLALFEGGIIGLILYLVLIIRCLSTVLIVHNYGKLIDDKVIEFCAITIFLFMIHYLIKSFWHDILVTEKIPWVIFGLIEVLWVGYKKRLIQNKSSVMAII